MQHMNSRVHQGSNSTCPFCKRGFNGYSGVSHHLETGSCPNAPQVNRENIYRFINARDTNNVITTKQLTWQAEVDGATYEANGSTWNGQSYECYLCHREFNQLRGLTQHLHSPAHKSKIYRCPNRGCADEFKSLAALFNHLESERCGFMRFAQVQQAGTRVFHNRLIAF